MQCKSLAKTQNFLQKKESLLAFYIKKSFAKIRAYLRFFFTNS